MNPNVSQTGGGAGVSATALWCFSLGLAALFCPMLAIAGFVAVALGLLEIQNIRKGASPRGGWYFAWIGMIGGAIGSLLATIGVCYLLFEGAREVEQFLIDASHSKWF